MKPGLAPGARARHSFTIDEAQTVPRLYPESPMFRAMPGVFATGYMVGLLEWACIEQIAPYYEEGEGSLGTHIDVSHLAPTPPGMTVTVETELTQIEGKFLWFRVRAHDGADLISEGRHQRALVLWDKFVPRVMAKRAKEAVQ